MKRRRARRRRGAAIIAVLCIAALAAWQWQTVVRLAVVAVADNVGQVRVSLGRSAFGWNEARLEDVRVTSRRGEAIAEIARLRVAYDPRDWLPGGKHLLGLVAVQADAPHLTIVRHPDGSYNVPIPNLQASRPSPGRTLLLSARVRNGSIDVIDERPLEPPGQGHLYVRGLGAAADFGTARSHYAVGFGYGERAGRLYPVRGRGDIDLGDGYVNQRWTARALPIAGAVNFALDSASLRFLGGTLQSADLRYVGLRGPDGALVPHLAASALLEGGRISIAGLSQPVHDIRGPIDVYDDGLLTPGFAAILAGTRVRVSGGIYNVRDPHLRVVVNGSGRAEALRSAIAQARRLPIEGPLSFALLVEGKPANPITWVALRSPRITYAATSVERVSGLVALDGRAADVVRFDAAYDRVELSARGRVGFAREPGAIELLLGIDAPPRSVPYVGTLLPAVPLRATAVARADDPKAIAAQGALWGAGATQQLNALFNVDGRGRGSIGPLHLRSGSHSLYARVALDRPAGVTLGLLAARNFALPSAHAVLDANAVGAQTKSGIEAGVAGRITSAWGAADARGTLALSGGTLRGSLFGNAGREASFGATLAGTPQSPRMAGTVVVAGGRYKEFDVNGDAGMAYDRGALRLRDAAVAVGPLFVGVAGTIDGLSPKGAFAPRVDLAAQARTSDVKTLLATVQPRSANLVEGSLDADVRVRGAALAPSVAGVVRAPEGSFNGLAFRDLRGVVRGNLAAASVSDGRVVIGETAVGFHGDRVGSRTNVAFDAPQADLADFNDYFDTGDTLAGTGRLAAQATLEGTRVVATSGDANLSYARYLRLDVGSVAARWTTRGTAVATTLSLGGPTGRFNVAGSVTPATMSVNLTANARGVDLGTWLPMLGLSAPVTGRLDAQTTIAGRYPDVGLRLHAAVLGGTAGRLSLDRFELTASAAHGRGTLSSAILDVPGLSTTASGTFGLRENDPIALVAHSTSPDVGALLLHATGKKAPLAGALDSTLRLEGTRAAPRLRDAMTLSSLRYGNLMLPRVAATIEADRHALRIESGEVDLEHGRALLSALVPINVSRAKIGVGGAPISAALRADDVELSNFAALLPKGTSVAGRIDGQVSAGGMIESPRFDGALHLRGGRFSGPIERTPVESIVADLTFAGQQASLQSRAAAGGGALTADGSATLGSLRNPAASALSFRATAAKAKLDMPDYFQGQLDADVSVARAAFATPRVGGNVSVSNARIPLNAFLNQKGGVNPHRSVPDVAFGGLRIAAGPNVRIQSRNVDIGATGNAALNGTLAAPTLTGEFSSAGGSLSFYRNFNVEKGTVRFEASSGVIPDVDAVATTFVSDPATAIRLHVTGPVTDMNLALASDPAYSREQILGILVGAQQFGAVRGVRSSGQTFSAGAAATNVALGQLNNAFTRNLLEPLNAQLAGTLGFSEVRITTDIQTGVGVSAVKAFGKNVNAIFGQTFGYPRTQSVTLEAHPSVGTGLRLMVYTAEGPSVLGLAQQQPIGLDVMNLNPLTSFTPTSGTNGFTFSYQRKFP